MDDFVHRLLRVARQAFLEDSEGEIRWYVNDHFIAESDEELQVHILAVRDGLILEENVRTTKLYEEGREQERKRKLERPTGSPTEREAPQGGGASKAAARCIWRSGN